MDTPVLIPVGVKVSATTLASKLARSGSVEHTAPVVQYTPEVLESIRLLCLSSYVADGAGVPVLGLLYGTRNVAAPGGTTEIRITAWTPAGELRSHNDAEFALQLQMRLAPQRSETAGLECLGWMRTRNHGEPRMAEEDRALFDHLFPAAWQTSMIVRPSYQRPVKAAFYVRGPGGVIRFDRPAQEFFLFPAQEGVQEGVPEGGPLGGQQGAQPGLHEAAPEPPAARGSSWESGGPMLAAPRPEDAFGSGASAGVSSAASPSSSTAHQHFEQRELEQHRVEQQRVEQRRVEQRHPELLPPGTVRAFSPWIAPMLVIVGLLAGTGVASLRPLPGSQAPVTDPAAAASSLRVVPASGAGPAKGWTVVWDPALAFLPGVSAGSLTVTSSSPGISTAPQARMLTVPQLRAGQAAIGNVPDDAELLLRISRPGHPDIEQRVRVLGLGAPRPQRGGAQAR